MPRSDRQRNRVQDGIFGRNIEKKLTEAERKQNQKIGKMTINKEDKRKIKADGKRPQGWKILVVYTVI